MAGRENKGLAQLFKDFLPKRIDKEVSGQNKMAYSPIDLKCRWENIRTTFRSIFILEKKAFF